MQRSTVLSWMLCRSRSRCSGCRQQLAAAEDAAAAVSLPWQHPSSSTLPAAPYVPGLTLHHFFDWRWVSFRSFQGWMVSLAFLVNALAAAAYLRLLVRRAKKCLDFAATILVIHFALVAAFSGFPRSVAWCAAGWGCDQRREGWRAPPSWPAGESAAVHAPPIALPLPLLSRRRRRWTLHGTNLAVTALLGEWLCIQKELQEIPMTSLRRNAAAAAKKSGGAAASAPAGSSSNGAGSSGGGALLPRSSGGRGSTAHVLELGRMDGAQAHDLQLSGSTASEWAALSPVNTLPPPPR